MNNFKRVNPGKEFFLKSLILMILFFAFATINVKAQKLWEAPSSAKDLKNPLAGNTSDLKEAKVLYISYCSPCHGEKGEGNGPAAAGLPIKPADHSSEKVQEQPDGALYWMISTGHTPMPAYQKTLTDNQRWELVNYIRTLAKHKK